MLNRLLTQTAFSPDHKLFFKDNFFFPFILIGFILFQQFFIFIFFCPFHTLFSFIFIFLFFSSCPSFSMPPFVFLPYLSFLLVSLSRSPFVLSLFFRFVLLFNLLSIPTHTFLFDFQSSLSSYLHIFFFKIFSQFNLCPKL